jgi:hypothetical protein
LERQPGKDRNLQLIVKQKPARETAPIWENLACDDELLEAWQGQVQAMRTSRGPSHSGVPYSFELDLQEQDLVFTVKILVLLEERREKEMV